MTLNFGGFQLGGSDAPFITGVQYDRDAKDIKLIHYTLTSTDEETVYTVPAGKTFYMTKATLMNFDDANVHTFRFKVNTHTVYRGQVAAADVYEIYYSTPCIVNAGETITADSDHTGSMVALIGWEV